MGRAPAVASIRGNAAGSSDVIGNLFGIVGRTIWQPEDEVTIPNSDVLKAAASNPDLNRVLRDGCAFVLGGLDVLQIIDMPANSYNNDPKAIRDTADELISQRKWDGVIEALKHTNGSDTSLFGKVKLNEYISHLRGSKIRPVAPVVVRQRHLLRLGKALEFMILTEANLTWQVDKKTDVGLKFKQQCVAQNLPDVPMSIWDMTWVEPIVYCPSKLLGSSDIVNLMKNSRLVEDFKKASAQNEGALLWALLGLPCKMMTAQAASDAINAYRRAKPADEIYSRAVTAEPKRITQRVRTLPEHIAEIVREKDQGPLKVVAGRFYQMYERVTEYTSANP